MRTRRLGRTGHQSTLAILGGAAFAQVSTEEAEAGFHAALAAGVNHLDIAPSYGDAISLVGPQVPAVRDRLFVACKTHRHAADGVRAQLEESLRLLGCDYFDLYQLHGVTDLADLDSRRAAAEAILRARDEGLCRFVGVTGHNVDTPLAQAEALRRYDLDTVMFPISPRLWADPVYRADAEALLALCSERDVGVMAIKAVSARPWGDRERHTTTWYEPYVEDDEVMRGVRFALSIEGVHAICTASDLGVMKTSLAAAEAFSPMDERDRAAAMAAVAHEPLIFPIPDGFGSSRVPTG
jgi:aryl-alcohol dehydrogenase-like predicted oxidoreductase